MIPIFIRLFIIGLILIIYGFLTCEVYSMLMLLFILLLMVMLVIILLYIILSIVYRCQNKENRTPLFTYKQLKSLLLLDKISISGDIIYILYDRIPPYYSTRYDRVGTYSYSDFLRLKWLYNYQVERLRDLERKQHKAEVLQRIQETINKEYEKIEQEITEVKNNENSDSSNVSVNKN